MTPPALSRRRCLTALAALAALAKTPPAAGARLPADAPPLLLALDAPPDLDPAGWLVSEKYDGVRAVWDGRTLRFRSGLPIAAPAWFTARLPATPLDGELWLARGRFEALSGMVRRHDAVDADWRQLQYMVFELPAGMACSGVGKHNGAGSRFAERAARIQAIATHTGWPQLQAVQQAPVANRQALLRQLDAVVAAGGEGLVLHRADAACEGGRSGALLKLKPLQDAEARVVACLPGRGKHAGRMGALHVRTDDGQHLFIGTGFSDAQRAQPPAIGSEVTFTYRGRTQAGVPRFASFLRVRSV